MLLEPAVEQVDLHRRAPALSTIPTLIIWGMKDSAFPPNQLARWRALLPHATVRELAEAGHWPHEEAPSEVAEAIDEFLAVT
jgi:haloalkane dehalogenase